MPLGYSDLKSIIQLPGTWDLTYLRQRAMKDGTTYDQVVRDVGGALLLFNRTLTGGYWSQYVMLTEEIGVEYDIGSDSSQLQKLSEYTRADPIRGVGTGHMLPLADYGGALGWTYMALRDMTRGRVDRDIRRLISRARNTWDIAILTRLFKMEADTVGGTGKSVPFADAGVADADYIPASYNGQSFASTHTHFLRHTDDAAGRLAAAKAAATHLLEHGLMSPWELVIPEADIADWTAVTGFKKPERGVIITAGVEVRALVNEEEYIGVLEVDNGYFRVKSTPRLPTDYAGAFKPTGFDDPDTVLAARRHPRAPLGLSLVATIQHYPLQEAQAMFTFGIGVNNRLAGVAIKFAASGAYSTPTIT